MGNKNRSPSRQQLLTRRHSACTSMIIPILIVLIDKKVSCV